MGELGRSIAKADVTRLLDALQQAYADEWFAHYNFQFTANSMRGYRAPSIVTLLTEKSAQALSRANRLADRLQELGGRPTAKLTDLSRHATDKPFKLPPSMTDVEGVLKAVLDAERTSIRTYQALYEETVNKDPVTSLLVQQWLAESVHGEEELERLLGDSAPGMRGTAD